MELTNDLRYNVLHNLFLDISLERFLTAEKAYVELANHKNENEKAKAYELLDVIRKNCIETVCFSVMSLESYINTFCDYYVSRKFFETIDHLDVLSKFIVTVKVYKQIDLEKGEKPIQKIAQSIKYRNKYVHSKSRRVSDENGSFAIPNIDLLKDYMDIAYDSLLALKETSEWIKENCDDDVLNIDVGEFIAELKSEYKNVENSWCFQEPIVYF